MRKIIESGMISNAELKKLKSTYKKGDRVELLKMNDRQAPPIGTKGTVQHVDDIGTIHVRWDTGSGLGVVYGEDKCVKISEGVKNKVSLKELKDAKYGESSYDIKASVQAGDFYFEKTGKDTWVMYENGKLKLNSVFTSSQVLDVAQKEKNIKFFDGELSSFNLSSDNNSFGRRDYLSGNWRLKK